MIEDVCLPSDVLLMDEEGFRSDAKEIDTVRRLLKSQDEEHQKKASATRP